MKRTVLLVALFACVGFSSQVLGAQITDVQSSFDHDDPFDIRLTINYEFHSESSKILREAIDYNAGKIDLANKLEYERSQHIMHFNLAIGLFRDLELVVDLPYVISDQGNLNLHSDIPTGGYGFISDIDPDAASYGATAASLQQGQLFDVPFNGRKRSGLGDIGLGLRWAPWHYNRDQQYPSWIIGLMFRIPTATVREAGNDAVGTGLFQVELNTAISRRVTWFFEPYFDLHGNISVSTDKSLFDNLNERTQTLQKPGNSMGLKIGTEFIPWEVPELERHFTIDLGFGLDYVFEGREYSELFEALGSSPCIGVCDKTVYTGTKVGMEQDPNKGPDAAKQAVEDGTLPRSDGITDVEHYGIYSAWLGLHYQPLKYFAVGTSFQFAYVQPHFITFADAGKNDPLDPNQAVDGYNLLGDNEYNPKYVEEWDEIGSRFKTTQKWTWTLMFNLTGKF